MGRGRVLDEYVGGGREVEECGVSRVRAVWPLLPFLRAGAVWWARGSSPGYGRGRAEGWRGWVIWKPRAAPVGLRRSELPLSRGAVLERTGPSGAPGVQPRARQPRPGGSAPCGPAYARGPAAAAGAGDVAPRGAWRPPTCHARRPSRDFLELAPARGGQAQWLPLFSLPFPSVYCPPAWWSWPWRRRRRPPRRQRPRRLEFCRRGAVTALPPESALFFSGEKEKVVVMRTGLGGTKWGTQVLGDFAPGRDVERNTGSLRPQVDAGPQVSDVTRWIW